MKYDGNISIPGCDKNMVGPISSLQITHLIIYNTAGVVRDRAFNPLIVSSSSY